METKSVIKVVAAFLVGVVLALGGAILHSRDTTVMSAVQPSHKSSVAPVKPAPSVDEPAQTIVPQQITTTSDEPEPSAPVEPVPATPPPVRSKPAGRAIAEKHVAPPTQIAQLRTRPPSPETAPANQTSSVVPPAGPLVPETNRAGITTAATTAPAPVTPVQHTQPSVSTINPKTPSAPVPEPHVVTLPAGTTLSVRLTESLSSERNREGDEFAGTLDTPVIADGFIIADRRSRVVGRVVQSSRAGRIKGLANIELTISEINTTDSQRVPVETDSYQKWGNSSTKGDTAKVAGAAAVGAIIGAIAGGGTGAAIGAGAGGLAGTGVALGTRGSDVSVPSESILTFRLARSVTITEKFN